MRAIEGVAERIVRVILDFELARLYGVETRVLLQAIRRNIGRFPLDFVFQLSNQELAALRSQSVISKRRGRGGRSSVPYAFTEHGAIMAATVLSSARAIDVSVYVVRAFVQLRNAVAAHTELGKRLDELQARLENRLGAHDRAISGILEAIRRLASPPQPPKRAIGFVR